MQDTVKNRTIFCCDNLPILRGIDTGSIDLIYLDPPFNKGKNFHAPIGTTAEGAGFKDIWSASDVKDEWHNQINDKRPDLYKYLDAVGDVGSRSAKYYLIFMYLRLMEMHRILKSTGSLYLHCDPTMSHYLKLLMDAIFGVTCFRNEIVWYYKKMPNKIHGFQKNHDIILFYNKSEKYHYNTLHELPTPESVKTFNSAKNRGYNVNLSKKMVTIFDMKKYQQAVQSGRIPNDLKPKAFTGGKPPMRDCWIDIKVLGGPKNKERLGYPTQKPLALLERIIKSSSNKGDVVLDPFCGCATTCVAAEKLDRRWVGIDVSSKAYDLVKARLNKGMEAREGIFAHKVICREDIPARTDRNGKKSPTKEDKQRLFGQQNGRCVGCKTRFEIQHLAVDHIIPQSEGGWHEIENLQLLCSHCNSIKGDRPMEYLLIRLKALYG